MPYLNFSDVLPDGRVLLQLQPEELAGAVLEVLNSRIDAERHRRQDVFLPSEIAAEINPHMGPPTHYPPELRHSIVRAIMEAWVWLEREGMIAPAVDNPNHGATFVTRRGRQYKRADDLAAYRRASVFPKNLIHATIADRVWLTFLRGEYDTAVFQAFKEVEVAVRAAGKYAATDIGVQLMRKAFDKTNGPLSNPNLPEAEQEALAHLFAGAIGSYKNPQSHRTVAIDDPQEAIEMIMLASHLLRIVDARVQFLDLR